MINNRRENYEKMIGEVRARFAAGTNNQRDNVLATRYSKAAKLTAACKTFWYLENENKRRRIK